jgi:hypothetical protein
MTLCGSGAGVRPYLTANKWDVAEDFFREPPSLLGFHRSVGPSAKEYFRFLVKLS